MIATKFNCCSIVKVTLREVENLDTLVLFPFLFVNSVVIKQSKKAAVNRIV